MLFSLFRQQTIIFLKGPICIDSHGQIHSLSCSSQSAVLDQIVASQRLLLSDKCLQAYCLINSFEETSSTHLHTLNQGAGFLFLFPKCRDKESWRKMNNWGNKFLIWNGIRNLTSHRTRDTRVYFYPLTHQYHGHEQRLFICLGCTVVAEMMHGNTWHRVSPLQSLLKLHDSISWETSKIW